MDTKTHIGQIIRDAIALKNAMLEDKAMIDTIGKAAEIIIDAFRQDRKLLICGNGGSAADAQHLAAEFSGKFYFDRPPLFAEALHVNTSYLTAVANDYAYEEVYARLVRAKGRAGDVLLGISTSGNSANVIKALEAANEIGMVTIGFTGEGGGRMHDICRYMLAVPSKSTPRIQEIHILAGHAVCEIVEKELFSVQ